VIGLLAGTAALFADPARAGGLDAALRTLSGTALGSSLLVVVVGGRVRRVRVVLPGRRGHPARLIGFSIAF
jgi:hypothetical protein